MENAFWVGVNVHKKVCRAAMVNDECELVDEFSFRNCSKGIEDFMMKIEAFRDRVLVAVESTLTCGLGFTTLLRSMAFRLFSLTLPRQG